MLLFFMTYHYKGKIIFVLILLDIRNRKFLDLQKSLYNNNRSLDDLSL